MARTIKTKSVTKVKGGPGDDASKKLKSLTIKGGYNIDPKNNRIGYVTGNVNPAYEFTETRQSPTPVKRNPIKTVKQIKTEARSEKREDRKLKRVARATKK